MARRVVIPFRGDTLGGSHMSCLALIESLDRARYEPLIVLHTEDGPLAAEIRRRGLEYTLLPVADIPLTKREMLRGFVRYAAACGKIVKFLRAQNIALVQTNDKAMRILWSVPCRLAGAKFVHFQRSPLLQMDWEQRITFRLCDYAIGISRYVTDTLPPFVRRKIFIDAPYDTDAPAPDREACAAALREKTGTKSDAPIVGYVANLQPRKRPLFFADIAALVLKQRPDAVFAMIGRAYGDMEARLAERAKEPGLEGRLHYLGFSDDAPKFMAGCDVLVAPAVNEASGRALVEAMLAGTPVIAANSGGHGEYIEDRRSGFLVAPEDAQGFGDLVLFLLGSPGEGRHVANTARAMALERFGHARHAAAVMAVYDEVCRR